MTAAAGWLRRRLSAMQPECGVRGGAAAGRLRRRL